MTLGRILVLVVFGYFFLPFMLGAIRLIFLFIASKFSRDPQGFMERWF